MRDGDWRNWQVWDGQDDLGANKKKVRRGMTGKDEKGNAKKGSTVLKLRGVCKD